MGGSYINGGVMDDPKTSIDLDQDQSNRAIFQGGQILRAGYKIMSYCCNSEMQLKI